MFYAVFITPKIVLILLYMERGRKNTFKCFEHAKRLLHRKILFDFLTGEYFSRKIPKIAKRKFHAGVQIPSKVRNCNISRGSETETCGSSQNLVCQHAKFEAK